MLSDIVRQRTSPALSDLINGAIIMKIQISSVFSVLFLGVLFGLAGTTNVSGQLQETILKRMDDHNKAMSSLRANVTMTKVNAQLGNVVDTTEGVVIYAPRRNGDPNIRIDWKRPEETFAVANGTYIILRPRLSQYITGKTKDAKGKGTAGGALAFMNMSRKELRDNYTIEYLGEAKVKGGIDTWHLRMTPKTPSSYTLAEVWVDVNGMPIQTKVTEKNKDTTTIYLSDLQKNVRIEAASFKVTIPKGAKEVKG